MSTENEPLTTAQAIVRLAQTLDANGVEQSLSLDKLGGIGDALDAVADAIREASGRDHGDIGFVGEIANGLLSTGSALNRLAAAAERAIRLHWGDA